MFAAAAAATTTTTTTTTTSTTTTTITFTNLMKSALMLQIIQAYISEPKILFRSKFKIFNFTCNFWDIIEKLKILITVQIKVNL